MSNPAVRSWQTENPELAKRCRAAGAILVDSQNALLEAITDEVIDNKKDLTESSFHVMEFLDKYGLRLQQLGMIAQMLESLGSVPK